MQAAKRKVDKEMEALQDRIDEMTSENNKVVKSKKKVQEEVSKGGRGRGRGQHSSLSVASSMTSW